MFARFDWVYRRNSFRAFVISIKTYWRVTPPMKREIRFIHTYLYVYSGLTKEKSSKRNEFGSSSDQVWVGFVSGLSQVWVEFRSGLGQVHTYFLDVNPLWTHVYLYTFFPYHLPKYLVFPLDCLPTILYHDLLFILENSLIIV